MRLGTTVGASLPPPSPAHRRTAVQGHRRRGPRPLLALGLALGLAFLAAGLGQAALLWEDAVQGKKLELNTGLKGTGLLTHGVDDPLVQPERDTAGVLGRARCDLHYADAASLDANLAYEHRWQSRTSAGSIGVGGSPLVAAATPSYRLQALDWSISDQAASFQWRHEIDRALVSLHPSWGEVTVGRQAIGLGRGRLFSAVDLFVPFSPTEIDREWRRGVDGGRLEYRLTDTASLETIAVFGPSRDESALLARARGYLGRVDGEVLLGKRGEDLLAAVVSSAAISEAEVHGEYAVFQLPTEQSGPLSAAGGRYVSKAVLGTSYTFGLGNGFTLLGEYHYSGFGLAAAEDATLLGADQAWRQRFLCGDTQTLGRHTLGLQGSYPVNETLTTALLLLSSATDGSGLLNPSLALDLQRDLSLLASLIIPWGPRPADGVLHSEYGGSPWSLLLQLNLNY